MKRIMVKTADIGKTIAMAIRTEKSQKILTIEFVIIIYTSLFQYTRQ